MRVTTSGNPDHAVYRTELSQQPGGAWRLSIDGVPVAETTDSGEPLDQDAAQEWARRQMGEGVRFLNGLFVDPSWYWVATPDTPERAMAAYHRNQHHRDQNRDRATAL